MSNTRIVGAATYGIRNNRLDEGGASFMSTSARTDSPDLDDVRPVTI
jgi:hypothetical protein